MIETSVVHVTVIASRERCVTMVFSADDILIKSLYQFSSGLVQTFN